MSVQPDRPVFTESQVLAAADLTLLVDHAAAAQARHERTLHTWGITAGLEMVPESDSLPGGGATFVRITLASGMATDGTGRHIVVAESQLLDEAAFEQVNGTTVTDANRNTWFPVFLTGRDQDPPDDRDVQVGRRQVELDRELPVEELGEGIRGDQFGFDPDERDVREPEDQD